MTLILVGTGATAAVQIRNFMTTNISPVKDLAVYPYYSGTASNTATSGDPTAWASGTFSNTVVAGGELRLTSTGTSTYAASGTWTSAVINSGTADPIYGFFEATAGTGSSSTNIALGKPATQSSTYCCWSPVASNAVDGDTQGNFFLGVASTDISYGGPEWWQVDLGAGSVVNSVALWNRTDCCPGRAANLWVMISANPFPAQLSTALADPTITQYQIPGTIGTPTTFTLPTPATGRYLRVWEPINNQYLTLGEVQVFGVGGSGSGTVKYQVATSDSASGPWTYVGPDGTSATSYTPATSAAFPYSADGNQYFRIQATLTGPGNATPGLASIRSRYNLVAATRSIAGRYPIPVSAGGSWTARIKETLATLSGKPASVALGTGSAWSTTSMQIGLDSPTAQCCSASFVTVTAGSAANTGATGINMFAAGTGAGVSVYSTRVNAVAATGNVDVAIAASGGVRIEVPLAITYA